MNEIIEHKIGYWEGHRTIEQRKYPLVKFKLTQRKYKRMKTTQEMEEEYV